MESITPFGRTAGYHPIQDLRQSDERFDKLEIESKERELFKLFPENKTKKNIALISVIALVTSLLIGIVWISFNSISDSTPNNFPPTTSATSPALFDESGRYIMRNYDNLKPMSSFLAGIGGLWFVSLF